MSDETLNFVPTYLPVRWRTQCYRVLGRKCLLVGYAYDNFLDLFGVRDDMSKRVVLGLYRI